MRSLLIILLLLFTEFLICCNPEPGALHAVKMPEPAPASKMPITVNGYWRTYNKSSGFVNDHITFVKGLTVEGSVGVFVGTRKNGVFRFSPSIQALSFNDWKLISEPIFEKKIISGNDLEYRSKVFYTATPVGLFKNDILIDKDELPLPSRNITGIKSLENGFLFIHDDCAYNSSLDQEFKVPDNQRIITWNCKKDKLILSTPKYLLLYNIAGDMMQKLKFPWCEVIFPVKDFYILGGIKKLKKYSQNEDYTDLFFQNEKELWVTDICGTYSEDLFKKPEPQKMNKKVSSADKNKMDLVDQIKKKIKEKTTFYNEKCKKAKDFLYEYVTAGYNAPQDIIDKFEKMVDKTLSLKNEIKKLTEIKINISKLGVKNTLWVGTKSNGIFTFDSKLKNWTNLDKKNSPLKSNEITTLYREKRYTWIGTADGGLYRYGKYDLTDSSLEPVLIEKGDFSNVFKDGMTLYALKDKSSILIFDALAKKKSWISCDTDDILPDVINDIEIDDQSNLWVATGGNGICVFDGSAWDSFTVESGLPSNDIQKICWLDQSKTLIAASKTGLVGLSDRISTYDGSNWERYDFQTFKSRLDPNGIRYKVVTEKDFIYDNTAAANTPVHSFYKSERSILIGTDAGLYVFSGEKWMKENSLFKKFSSSINQIGDLPNGKILFATLTGSYTHDGVHYGKIPVDTMGQPITSFVRDDQDQQLFWFSSGVFNKFGTLSSYHLGSGEATMKVFKFAVNKIVIIAPYVFMATSKGLYYMRMIM